MATEETRLTGETSTQRYTSAQAAGALDSFFEEGKSLDEEASAVGDLHVSFRESARLSVSFSHQAQMDVSQHESMLYPDGAFDFSIQEEEDELRLPRKSAHADT